MSSLRQILAPVDFSDFSELGLRYAHALAKCSGAAVTALHAETFETPAYFTSSRIEDLERQFRESQRDAERYLRDFTDRTLGPEGASVATLIDSRKPAEAILSVVERLPANLVVMGTHGRSGWDRLMMGSVTERVVRTSRVPVLTVRGARDFRLERILCPVNDSPAARAALDFSLSLAACFHAKVTLMHVSEGEHAGSIQNLCAWLTEEQRSQCEVIQSEGDVAQEVIETAGKSGSDLLVLGLEHRTFFDATVIGANTARILRHAPCPVLAVPARTH